jgi:hypothetical protein
MPWIANGVTGLSQGVTGSMYWFRPDAGIGATADFHVIPYPTTQIPGNSEVTPLDSLDVKPVLSTDTNTGHTYGTGGWTDNIILTRDMALWQLGISPPVIPPAVTLVAGPGVTASIICYWSYYDENTDEDSPLSGPSTTLAAVNQQFNWPVPPAPLNGRVTHIRYWRSVDGSLPRLVMQRQVGVIAINEAVPLGQLGQSFTDVFDKFPRCRYSAVWHDRLVCTGNDTAPNEIYLSLIGKPEKRSTLTLKTRSGQPVVGLVVVRDTLIVLCPRSSEIVTGFSEDDLAINIAQPQIGCIANHGIQVIHGIAWIPTHLGLYLCDGSSWFFLADDIRKKWATEYRAHAAAYENGWSIHDPVTFVYSFYIGQGAHSDFTHNEFVSWVADYQPVVQQVGGGLGQPNWSYDTTSNNLGGGDAGVPGFCSAALFALPGGRRQDTYLGANDGKIYKYSADPNQLELFGDVGGRKFVIRTGADSVGDEGGDLAHGKRFTEVDYFVQSEQSDWVVNVYAGEEAASTNPVPNFTKPVAASATTVGGNPAQPKGTHFFPLPQVVGQRVVVELTAPNPAFMEFRGYQFYYKEGESPRYTGSSTVTP